MQVQNLLIYSAAQADASNNGPWIDISNLVSLSVQANNYVAGKTDIQVSNDPNVMIDGAAIGPPSAGSVLSAFVSTPGFNSLTVPPPGDVSQLPATTFFVKTTFVTKWGETTGSAETSLAVPAGSYLYVAAPVPTTAQAPYVTGYNVYVGLSTGTEVLQTGPAYSPQRSQDGIGTVGGTVNPLGPNQSTHFAISGAIPMNQPGYSMVNGYQSTGIVVPGADNSGGANSGVSVSNGAGLSTLTPDEVTTVAVFISGSNLMWTPSCMTWKFLRVVNGTSAPGTTVAYLEGQRG